MYGFSRSLTQNFPSTMVPNIFEDFELPSKNFLATPLTNTLKRLACPELSTCLSLPAFVRSGYWCHFVVFLEISVEFAANYTWILIILGLEQFELFRIIKNRK